MVPQSPNANTHPASINGMPQIIAHRGYKAAFPENTMAAFRGAVEAGAHAIETDLHLSKDGVVVLAHVRNRPTQFCPFSPTILTFPSGPLLKTHLWHQQKGRRLRLGLPQHPPHPSTPPRAPRPPLRPPRVHRPARPLLHLAPPRHQGPSHFPPPLSPTPKANPLQLTDDPTTLLTAIATTLSSTPPLPSNPWPQRVLLGCWTVRPPPPPTLHPN